jgi:hypothetical protein
VAASLLVVLALQGAPPTGRAGEPADAASEKFQRWATDAARRKGTTLCRMGVARFSPQDSPAHFALFQRQVPGDTHFALVIAWPGNRRAFRTADTLMAGFDCVGKPSWEQGKVIKLGPWGQQPRESADVAVVDGQLVLVEVTLDDPGAGEFFGWDSLVFSGRNVDDKLQWQSSILLLLDSRSAWRARLPKPKTWVTFQRTPHGGPADSELSARVDLVGPDLRIEMEATDDVARPLVDAKANDAAFLKADHFELWFCAAGASAWCDKKGARQLGIARTAGGLLHARWLHPKGNKEKLPVVAQGTAKSGLVVALPLAQIRNERGLEPELEGELSVAYSDADVDGKGQEAVIATSQVRWGVGRTFGRFVRHKGGTRFPAWETTVAGFDENEALLKDLPKP